ncbi:hypothetical protein [Frankia sp. BMG5.23]|uniref:hypothetical protein n=1 Tax=Frankia sp. BMG5.23 TaxID=683305 RepID=UPI000461D09E|nr:hypothetical protein [Frankia sp. BMG5.23]KDA44963.1 hypothetical protein BMG523Draft_00088 [Frankia sp. BMG5.23]
MTLLLLLLTLTAFWAIRRTLAWLATHGPQLRRPAAVLTAAAVAIHQWPTALALTATTTAVLTAIAAITLTRHPAPLDPTDADLDTATR